MPPLPPSAHDSAIDRFKPDAPRFSDVLRKLSPYVWPTTRPDLRRRIYLAFALMIVAKLVTVAVPYAFKWATDAVAAEARGAPHDTHRLLGLVLGPLALTALYGAGRVLMQLTTQGRDALFAAVAMKRRAPARAGSVRPPSRAVAALPSRAQDRRTDPRPGARPQCDRDDRAGDHCLTAVPTVVEFALILVVLFFQFDIAYVGVVFGMIVVYLAWTFAATNWRMSIRRSMNESDTDANTKAIDSLLNYETVKYFGAEAPRGAALRQVDGALRGDVDQDPTSRSPCSTPGRR